MRIKETMLSFGVLAAIWLVHFMAPNIISVWVAVTATAALSAHSLGDRFRRKRAANMPTKTTQSGQVFPVKRRLMAGLGWFCVVLALLIVYTAVPDADYTMVFWALATFAAGVFLIISARNVREIRIDDQQIQFLPVGTSLPLDEIASITPQAKGGAPAHIELNTKTPRSRYVPGVIRQWNGGCKLNIVGSNGDAVLSALQQRLPSA